MKRKIQVSFATKWLSNLNYLREVPVEGKKCNRFYYKFGLYDLYIAQLIRSGSAITLLSNPLSITLDQFWKPHHLEDYSQYVFWTFNKSFLQSLAEKINVLPFSILSRCKDQLEENFTPYQFPSNEDIDEELQWCVLKNSKLKADAKFNKMYQLDEQNRTYLLNALKEKIAASSPSVSSSNELQPQSITDPFIVFLESLNNDTNYTPQQTYQFILDKIKEAEFDFDLFSPIPKLKNGKNPYGLNGCIAAMIDFFFQQQYFKPDYTLEQVFEIYMDYTGNRIAKFKTFLSEFRQDKHYLKYFNKLKSLKISRLNERF